MNNAFSLSFSLSLSLYFSLFLSPLRAKLSLNFKRCALCVPSCVPEADDVVCLRGSRRWAKSRWKLEERAQNREIVVTDPVVPGKKRFLENWSKWDRAASLYLLFLRVSEVWKSSLSLCFSLFFSLLHAFCIHVDEWVLFIYSGTGINFMFFFFRCDCWCDDWWGDWGDRWRVDCKKLKWFIL